MEKRNIIEEMTLKQKLRKVIRLHKILNTFQYGIEENGKIVGYPPGKEWANKYHYLSPDEFFRVKGGVCWDYAQAQYVSIKNLGMNVINIYIEFLEGNHDTHTFTVIKIKDRYVYIESSFQRIQGIYYSTHILPIIKFVLHAMMRNHPGKVMPYTVHMYPGYDNYGCDVLTFMDHMLKQKRLKKGYVKYDETVEQPLLLCESVEQLDTLFDDVTEPDLMFEAAIGHTFYFKNLIYSRICAVLDKPEDKRKYRQIQNQYIERNMPKLTTPGPQYLIVFGDSDKAMYYNLFGITQEEIQKVMIQITYKANPDASFKLLRQNPILVLLYFCIRYFTEKNDKQSLNSTLAIYTLANYWSLFTKFFPKGVIAPVMEYTIDNMTDKFSIKRAGSIFNVLMQSIQQSYSFHKKRILAGGDDDTVAFVQRIRNDQNSLMRKIANEYMKNYDAGNAITTRNDDYDPDNPILDDIENSSAHTSNVLFILLRLGSLLFVFLNNEAAQLKKN